MAETRTNKPMEAHLEPGESVIADARLFNGSASTGRASLTERRLIIFETGSVSMKIVGGPLREIGLGEVVNVETKKMRPVLMLGVPFFFVDVELIDGSHLTLRSSGVGVPKLSRFADALRDACSA